NRCKSIRSATSRPVSVYWPNFQDIAGRRSRVSTPWKLVSAGAWSGLGWKRLVSIPGVRGVRFEREVRPGGYGNQHLLLTVDQRGGVIAGDLESVAVCDRIRGTGFHAVSAK